MQPHHFIHDLAALAQAPVPTRKDIMPAFLASVRRLLPLLAGCAALFGMATPASAQLAFSLRTGNNTTNAQSLVIDSNNCVGAGPRSMYVGGVLSNNGATTVNNINANIIGLNANAYLAGGQQAAQALGSLAPGERLGVYWFIGYGCTPGATANASLQFTSSAPPLTRTINMTIRTSQSANAGGQVLSASLGPGAVVGQNVYFGANYDFAGPSAGGEFFLQPAGGQNFNAACFRLVGTQVTGTNVNAAPLNSTDTMYYVQGAAQSGNGYYINMRYTFQYRCADTATVARPFASQTSGNTNIKYTGNFDGATSVPINYPGATNPFTITKTVTPTSAITGSSTVPLVYTVTISNPSPYDSIVDRIVDTLPAGVSFNSLDIGTVTAANSSSIPAVGATGTINFIGKVGQSYAIPAGGSVVLKYKANRPTANGNYTNSAQALFGQATTPVATATYSQSNTQALTVTKVSTVISDPVRNASNPLALPDAIVEYAIGVTNPNTIAMDANSVEVNDGTPPQLRLCTVDIGGADSGPVTFTDGAPSSGLTWTYSGLASTTDSLDFSNNGGTTWTYTPAPAADGCDSAITNFRAKPSGALAAGGNFTLRARYRIK